MDDQPEHIELYHTPRLEAPCLVAAWSGMGAVALLAVNYLRQALSAELFGEVDAQRFHAPTQVIVQDGVLQAPVLPETKLYSWAKGLDHDLVIAVGTDQPDDAYGLAQHISMLAVWLGVERVYTLAASPTFVHHSQQPRVWGTATSPELVDSLQDYGVRVMDRGTIGGLNGLLLAVAKEHDIDGLCLLGEIPVYTTQMVNPKASGAVLAVLAQMLGLKIDLEKLTTWSEDLESQMDRIYDLLPSHVKEAIERGEGALLGLDSEPAESEQQLVADEAFFQDIERFLEEHRHEQDDEQNDQDAPAP